MAIRVEYGPDLGLLGALAASSGAAEYSKEQSDRDLGLILSQLNRPQVQQIPVPELEPTREARPNFTAFGTAGRRDIPVKLYHGPEFIDERTQIPSREVSRQSAVLRSQERAWELATQEFKKGNMSGDAYRRLQGQIFQDTQTGLAPSPLSYLAAAQDDSDPLVEQARFSENTAKSLRGFFGPDEYSDDQLQAIASRTTRDKNGVLTNPLADQLIMEREKTKARRFKDDTDAQKRALIDLSRTKDIGSAKAVYEAYRLSNPNAPEVPDRIYEAGYLSNYRDPTQTDYIEAVKGNAPQSGPPAESGSPEETDEFQQAITRTIDITNFTPEQARRLQERVNESGKAWEVRNNNQIVKVYPR